MGDFKVVYLANPVQINMSGTITYKGAYAAGTDYAVGESVDYLGSSYVMYSNAAAGTLPTDTDYWQILAEKGDTGAQGIQGIQGETGASGVISATTDVSGLTGVLKVLTGHVAGSATTADLPDSLDKRYVTDAQLTNIANGQTAYGWGNHASAGYAPLASPIFTTQIETPLIIGGQGTTSDLILRTTSGVGASGADMIFQTGNNGGTEAMRILYDGQISIKKDLTLGVLDASYGSIIFPGISGTSYSKYITSAVNKLSFGSDSSINNVSRVTVNSGGYVGILGGADGGNTTRVLALTIGNAGMAGFFYGPSMGIDMSHWEIVSTNARSQTVFKLLHGTNDYVDVMILRSNGNVGLGEITSPTSRLHVVDTVNAGSGSLAAPILELAQTWNTSGTIDGAIRLTVTDTASNAASLLFNLKVGASSKASINKAGNAIFAGTVQAGSNSYFWATGTNGNMYLGVDGTNIKQIYVETATNPKLSFGNTPSLGLIYSTTNTATSGSAYGLSIKPIYNQASGTAANTDLLINRTETAVGSGAQLLIDAQVSGVSKASISNIGNAVFAGSITANGGLQTFGANDSGGAGYRVVLVPNA